MTQSENATDELLMRAVQGGEQAVNELLARHRDRLRRMVVCHRKAHLAARVDPSDVLQAVFFGAAESLARVRAGKVHAVLSVAAADRPGGG